MNFASMGSLIAAAAVALSSSAASAFQWEVGGGVSRAHEHGDGVWYQKAFPHELKLQRPAFKVGMTGDLSPHWRWHLDAVSLGRYNTDAIVTPSDANYNAASTTGCNGACLPLVRITGMGNIFGVAATMEAHTAGAWQFGVEAGPFLYRARWRMRLIMNADGWYPWVESGSSGGGLRTYEVDRTHWALGGVLGVSVSRGPWTLSLREYLDGRGYKVETLTGTDPWPPIWRRHTVLMLNYRFD